MRAAILITSILILTSLSGYSQSHKYYQEKGIITAGVIGQGVYLLKIDTKAGEQKLHFKYHSMEGDMYIYDLIKVDDDSLSEYQRSISYLKTRTKFSQLCAGKGGSLFIKILGDSEIISL